jgi:hypothetical protein
MVQSSSARVLVGKPFQYQAPVAIPFLQHHDNWNKLPHFTADTDSKAPRKGIV